MLEDGRYQSVGEMAAAEKIDRSFVSRLMRLTLLAPDIQEAILEGRQPKGMQLEDLTRPVPSSWLEQRSMIESATFVPMPAPLGRQGPVVCLRVRDNV